MSNKPHSREKRIIDKTVKVEKKPLTGTREVKKPSLFSSIFKSLRNK